MAKTFISPFAQTPSTWNTVATTAFTLTGTNSLLDNAPTNTVLLGTAGTEGAIITDLYAIPRATNTLTMAALFTRLPGDGATVRRFLKSITIPAQTIVATASVTDTSFGVASESAPLRLAAGEELYVGVAVTQASGIVFTAHAVNF